MSQNWALPVGSGSTHWPVVKKKVATQRPSSCATSLQAACILSSLRPGGFRLRYGRARNTGLAAAGINPASMLLLASSWLPAPRSRWSSQARRQAVAPVKLHRRADSATAERGCGSFRFRSGHPGMDASELQRSQDIQLALKAHVSKILDLARY